MKHKIVFTLLAILLIASIFIDRLFLFHPRALFLNNITTYLIIALLFAVSFIIIKKKKSANLLWLSAVISLALSHLLKFVIARPRPAGITALTYSFPSGHAAVVFSLIPLLDKEFPKLFWLWISFAAIISLIRIVIGIHYLSDIFAGALLGYAIGYLFLRRK